MFDFTYEVVKQPPPSVIKGETGLVVPAVDGAETFASSRLFLGGLSGIDLSHSVSVATPETTATRWTITVEGTVSGFYSYVGENRKKWTQAQVVAFCREHLDFLFPLRVTLFFELEGNLLVDISTDEVGVGLWGHVGKFLDKHPLCIEFQNPADYYGIVTLE